MEKLGRVGSAKAQRPAGSDRHGFKSRRGRVGGTPKSQHRARPLRPCRRGRGISRVRCWAGSLIHHRRQPHRRRRPNT